MNSNIAVKAHSSIKEYIDGIDENKIQDRTLDKILSLYKEFISNIYQEVKPILKQNFNVKNTILMLKKRKLIKGSSKQEKINFNKTYIDELICLFKKEEVLIEIVSAYKKLLLDISNIKNWDKYEQWLGWALDFGVESHLATHISKLTHSSSKGSSIDARYNSYESAPKYLTTPEQPILDTAYPDNKYSSITQLYAVEVDGQYIGDLLRNNSEECLSSFTHNKDLLKWWANSFSKLIKNKSKKSYFLSKQTYFPVNDKKYHLLLPLTSSSLVQELHVVHKRYWSDEQKIAREQKQKKKYSTITTCTYPNKAYIHVTGSNHSNASSLNGKRGGRIALLSTSPPQWESKFTSYVDKASIFDKKLSYKLKTEIDDLKKYLLLIKNKSLSISEPKRNAAVIKKLKAISDNLFNYIEMINSHESNHNWTCESCLPTEQQLLFEPWRKDEAAIIIKKGEWKNTLSKNYARWLNKQLKQKTKLQTTSIHEELWANVFLIELREFIATQEVKS